jgi:GNAT superfamily N-acetyltransferase
MVWVASYQSPGDGLEQHLERRAVTEESFAMPLRGVKRDPMRYRTARSADEAKVADVYLTSRKTHLSYAPLAHSDDDVRKWIHAILIPTGRVTVALEEDEIVGMMATSIDDQAVAWIDHLYVEPSSVGQGVGSGLLTLALTALPRPIRLYTFDTNLGARRFYERHGFAPVMFGDGSKNEEGCPDVLYEFA